MKPRSALRRFWDRVNMTLFCWEWTALINKGGYGRFFPSHGKEVLAHRFSWQLHFGAIPGGLSVLHRCDNPKCVNPAHLFLGTQRDNVDDAVAKDRFPRGSMNAHAKLDEADVAEIIMLLAAGGKGREIAKRFGVNQSVICRIDKGKAWPQVPRGTSNG